MKCATMTTYIYIGQWEGNVARAELGFLILIKIEIHNEVLSEKGGAEGIRHARG